MLALTEINNYNTIIIKETIYDFLTNNNFNLKNEKILLKPNLISPKSVSKCATTHPSLIESIAELLIDFNNKIFIGDSPGVGSLRLNLKVAGFSDIINRLGIKIFPFNKHVEVYREENKILKRLKISNAAVEFEKIINIAKLKTHCMTGMTLSIKNSYGFIVGKDKVAYHLKAGYNIDYFADILIDIHETVSPIINIVDGIWAMEGNGPTAGKPIKLGILGVSEDGYLLDRLIEKLVGFPEKTVISKQAEKRGLLNEKYLPNIEFNRKIKIKLAKTKSATFRVPKFIANFFSVKPYINNLLCQKCLKCLNSCPPKAIIKRENRLYIDYSKCIKCYCCHELCVFEAVSLKRFIL